MKNNLNLSALAILLVAAGAFYLAGCASGPSGPVDDATLKQRVDSCLLHADNLTDVESSPQPIRVRVVDGVVHLTGVVNSQTEKVHAEQDVNMVGGVKSIVNNLLVNDAMKMGN